jgi:hypothetical protein
MPGMIAENIAPRPAGFPSGTPFPQVGKMPAGAPGGPQWFGALSGGTGKPTTPAQQVAYDQMAHNPYDPQRPFGADQAMTWHDAPVPNNPPPFGGRNIQGYKSPPIFDKVPSWEDMQNGATGGELGPGQNKFAYEKWRQGYYDKHWGRLGNPTAVGYPDWWRPGMQLNDGQGGSGINSGIQSTPVSNDAIAGGAYDMTQAGSNATQGGQGGAQGTIAQMLQDAARAKGSSASVDFMRNAAMQNAQYGLDSQTARAQSGIQWGNLGLQGEMGNGQYDQRVNSTLMELLGMFQ